MANTFTYNGVTINTPDIKTISCAAVYDQADASVMFTRMTYRVQGTIQFDNTYSMAQNMVYFRQALLGPRRGLKITIGDDVLNLGGGTAATALDDVGGPKPRRADFTEIIGTNFCFVTFEIEVGLQEGCTNTGAVLSHTYTVNHQLDSRFYTTRTVSGAIRVSNNAAPPYDNADALRGIAVPALPNGFQRKSMDFSLSADGLVLSYVIQDKEVFRVAPINCTEAKATFSQQMSNYLWYSHFTMEVKGNKYQDQLSMFNDIFLVASSRINFDDPTILIQQASIDEELYDNTVRFSITVGSGINPATAKALPADTAMFTAVPGNDQNANATLGPYGSYLMMSAKKEFFNPCANAPAFGFQQQPATDDDSGGTSDGTTPPDTEAPIGEEPGTMSEQQKLNPYTKWVQTITYEQVNGVQMLPSTGGKAGKVYQLHTPYMVITQEGDAVRVGAAVRAPTPELPFNGIVRRKRFAPFAPTPNPDKTTLTFAASWHYEIIVPFTDSELDNSHSLNGQAFVDTLAGTNGHQYDIPENDALNFKANEHRENNIVPITPDTPVAPTPPYVP